MVGAACAAWDSRDENQINDTGAEHLARALERNTTVTTIDLGGAR